MVIFLAKLKNLHSKKHIRYVICRQKMVDKKMSVSTPFLGSTGFALGKGLLSIVVQCERNYIHLPPVNISEILNQETFRLLV